MGLLNPGVRQLIILGLLREKPQPAQYLYEFMHMDYPGDNDAAKHRRFNDDMNALFEARLISFYGLEQEAVVTLDLPEKDRSLWLTSAEHRALSKARERLVWTSETSPLPPDARLAKLESLVRLLRLIEEDTTDVGEIAAALGCRPTAVRGLLDRLTSIAPAAQILGAFAIELDANGEASAGFLPPGSSAAPFNGRGLDEIGLFAYSRDEVDDRIAMIDAAMDDGAAGSDEPLLTSARQKLESWRNDLGPSTW